MTDQILLPYRVMVARSHALFVLGGLAQAYFLEKAPYQQFNGWIIRLRQSWSKAEESEEALERFKLDIATLEEALAGIAKEIAG